MIEQMNVFGKIISFNIVVLQIFWSIKKRILKTHTRNNRDEQSKSTIIYDSNFQILESKTYSQKNKLELLYEAIFNYENNKLMNFIIFY